MAQLQVQVKASTNPPSIPTSSHRSIVRGGRKVSEFAFIGINWTPFIRQHNFRAQHNLVVMPEIVEPHQAQPVPPVDLSKLFFQSSTTRRRIIASYWVVIILAIPIWWRITSIDRLSLPESRVSALDAQYVSTARVYILTQRRD